MLPPTRPIRYSGIIYFIFLRPMNFLNRLLFLLVPALSHLPVKGLYALADFLQFLMYYVVKYRKNVVFDNLIKSFPEKTEQEIRTIAKQFYRNFADIMVEQLRLRTMTRAEALKVIHFDNYALLEKYYNEGKNVIAVAGHTGNWEWLGAMALPVHTPFRVIVAAKPQTNKGFSHYIFNLRKRFGAEVISFKHTFKAVLKKSDQPTLTLLVADQSPAKQRIEFWMPFLHRETPVYLGAEKMAVHLNCPVVYINSQRTKRGEYHLEVIPVCEHPRSLPEHELTKLHVNLLEQAIREHPDNWLWSHKRWKHQKSKVQMSV